MSYTYLAKFIVDENFHINERKLKVFQCTYSNTLNILHSRFIYLNIKVKGTTIPLLACMVSLL